MDKIKPAEIETALSRQSLNTLIAEAKALRNRPSRTRIQWWIIAAYLALGFFVLITGFFLLQNYGGRFAVPSSIVPLSIGSVPPATPTTSAADELASVLETLGYAAASFGLGILGIGVSLVLAAHDKEQDLLLGNLVLFFAADKLSQLPPLSSGDKTDSDKDELQSCTCDGYNTCDTCTSGRFDESDDYSLPSN